MWINEGDTPLWLVVAGIVVSVFGGVGIAALLNRFGSFLSPDMIRWGLGGAGVLLLLVLLAIGVRNIFTS